MSTLDSLKAGLQRNKDRENEMHQKITGGDKNVPYPKTDKNPEAKKRDELSETLSKSKK